jgi:uncharacterized protein YjbJ (UPF0337 family)
MKWDRWAGAVRLQWGRLTGDYASVVAGLRQRSLDRIRAGDAVTKQASDKQLAEWLEHQHKVDPIHK